MFIIGCGGKVVNEVKHNISNMIEINITSLSQEMLNNIMSYLPRQDMMHEIGITCKKLFNIASKNVTKRHPKLVLYLY